MMGRKKLFLLHGALGSPTEWERTASLLSGELDVHPLAFPGHAGSAVPENMRLQVLTDFLNAEISKSASGEKVTVAGHSLGGYVALKAALDGNDNIAAVLTLGTKLFWSPEIAGRESGMLQPELLQEKVPHYAETLKKLHGDPQWRDLLSAIAGLLHELGLTNPLSPEKISSIAVPVRFMLGDRDQMVSLEETLHVQKAVQGSELSLLPGTAHPLGKANPERLAFEILDFIRRSSAS